MLVPSNAQAIEPRTCTPDTSSISSCFPDANLASTVAQKVGKNVTDTFTTADQNAITSLTHNSLADASTKITSLEGIQHLPHLQILDVTGNRIDTISQLSGLTELTSLTLDENTISDLTPLSGLNNLVSLSLRHNTADTLTPLSGLTMLSDLNIDQNHIMDLTPLAGLRNLTNLSVKNEQVYIPTPLPTTATTGSLSVAKGVDGSWIMPIDYEPDTSHTFDSSTGKVTWTGLTPHTTGISLILNQSFTLNGRSFIYTGTINQPKETDNWNVIFDGNGGTFNIGGGQFNTSNQEVQDHHTAVEPSPLPTRPGFTFIGWATDANGTTDFNLNTPITHDTTVYAKWRADQYTVHFDSNGGTPVPDQTGLTYGNHATKPNDPTKPGYDFDGWQIDDGNGNLVDFDFNTPITGNITLHAKWKVHEDTVHFDSNGGTPVPDQTVTPGGTINDDTHPTKPGYDFGGWQIDDGNGNLVDFDPATPINSDITLHAKWNPVGAAGTAPGANGNNGARGNNSAKANNGNGANGNKDAKGGPARLGQTGSAVLGVAAIALIAAAGASVIILRRRKKQF
ncbi:InlB B-repeat-containing protein [Bifidobacterium sp. ESL0798]|uniref:InlB B-repeat-containing protein n=1 Tax=Bifidobacterium sp. ESL0798 TaxID=2983235 RepID=UPI0023F6C1D5|nr:InlB B-repeat-containing protein [Bifidobacterium sp. ESL0798]WEV73895.1 InlB B-repeat-containing protein [Bifidobacterium sp. ESL0798]